MSRRGAVVLGLLLAASCGNTKLTAPEIGLGELPASERRDLGCARRVTAAAGAATGRARTNSRSVRPT